MDKNLQSTVIYFLHVHGLYSILAISILKYA